MPTEANRLRRPLLARDGPCAEISARWLYKQIQKWNDDAGDWWVFEIFSVSWPFYVPGIPI